MPTALVTGANKGIGQAIAADLGARGWTVLVGARDEARGREAADALRAQGVDAAPVIFELTDLDSVDRVAALVCMQHPELSLLINNAATPGYPMRAPGWQFEASELERIWRTNFLGPFELVKQLMDVLAANRGTVLNVSIPIEPSVAFNCFAYQTSKAPLNVMTKSLGLAFTSQDVPVRIFTVTPGGTSTDLNGHIGGPGVKTPEQAASVILGFLFDGADHNGQVINYDGRTYHYSDGMRGSDRI